MNNNTKNIIGKYALYLIIFYSLELIVIYLINLNIGSVKEYVTKNIQFY